MAIGAARNRALEWTTAWVFAAGAVAFTLAFLLSPPTQLVGLLVVATMTALSERLNIRLYFDGRVSVSVVGAIVAAIAFGPSGAAVVATVIAVTGGYLFADRSPRKLLFNFGHQNLAAVLAATLVLAFNLDGRLESIGVTALTGAGVGLVIFGVTTGAVAVAMSLSLRRPFSAIYSENFGWLVPHYAALGLMGGGLATVYAYAGVAGVVVLSTPLLLSRYSMKQVIDKTRESGLRLERSNQDLRVAVAEVSAMSKQLHEAYDGTLESLVAALDMRDQETRGHSNRVASHSVEIARLLGIKDGDELDMIYRGALMHDIGKIGVPDAILRKPGSLTEEEWDFMRRHPAFGYRILAQVPYLRPAARVVLAHHERWDGHGYPRRLKEEAIPLGARIFAIADTYDAIISDRPYRQGQSPDAAAAEILRCAGTQFDSKVVEAFESVFPQWREEIVGDRRHVLYLPGSTGGEGDDASTRAAS